MPQYAKMGCSYPCMGGTKVHTREFDLENIKRLGGIIEFVGGDIGRPLGSPQLMQWSNKRRFQYTL